MADRTCSAPLEPPCPRAFYAKDLCKGHYDQQRNGRPITPFRAIHRPRSVDPVEWFLAGLDTSGGVDSCHEWQRGLDGHGYGQADKAMRELYGTTKAHVLKWILEVGPIPDGLSVLHHCDNPPCGNVAPGHLFLGTYLDNTADKVAKGRQARGSRAGMAKLTEQQVLEIRYRLEVGETPVSIAGRYGVSPTAIREIRRGDTWRHL